MNDQGADGPHGDTVRRPGPLRWLWYSLGGGLPQRYSSWVLHDTTTPSWLVRQVVRTLLVLSPFVAILLFAVPGPIWVRVLAAVGGIIMGLIFALGYAVETTEHRLVKAGYPAGTGEEVRHHRSTAVNEAAVARRREKMFARMDRRSHR
jgi:Family of unknown function (DUF5313)